MAMIERAREAIAQPPIPFAEGQNLGSAGAPIPPNVANDYIAFLELHKRFTTLSVEEREAYHKAAARASSRNTVERGFAQTDIEKALDAAMTIEGYASSDGLPAYLREHGVVSPTLSAEIIPSSADGLRAYISGYDLREPAYIEDGQTYKGNVSIVDAYALGFLVRTMTLGIQTERDEFPISQRDWESFKSGMTKENSNFTKLARESAGDSVAFQRLLDMNALGIRIEMAIQRASR